MSWGPRSEDEGSERDHDTCADCGFAVSDYLTPKGVVVWTHDPIPVTTPSAEVPDDAISTGTHWHPQHLVRRARTIHVRTAHLHLGETEAAVREASAAGRDIGDAAAVTIASWWQSPGANGRHLAALASGAPVLAEDVINDVAHCLAHDGPDDVDAAYLDALMTWAVHYGQD